MRVTKNRWGWLHQEGLRPCDRCLLIGEGTRLRWDCPQGRADTSLGRLQWFDPSVGQYKRIRVRGRAEDTYVEELRDFWKCVQNGTKPLVGLDEGSQTLRVIGAIEEALRTNREVVV